MGGLADSTARVSFPADASLGPLVGTAARTYLRLYRLPGPVSRFILRRLQEAILRLHRGSKTPVSRAALTLSGGAGRVRVALRAAGTAAGRLRQGSPAKGSPQGLQVEYRTGRGGGTLRFMWKAPRKKK